jgi:hypothetical protein
LERMFRKCIHPHGTHVQDMTSSRSIRIRKISSLVFNLHSRSIYILNGF